jgi:hypothetical protein
MSNQPVGNNSGIFSLFFREAGLFWEQVWQWAEQQSKEDRELSVSEEQRRQAEAQARKAEAEAHLLEQVRLAKSAGLDVDEILRRARE